MCGAVDSSTPRRTSEEKSRSLVFSLGRKLVSAWWWPQGRCTCCSGAWEAGLQSPWGASPWGAPVPGVRDTGGGRARQRKCDTLTVATRCAGDQPSPSGLCPVCVFVRKREAALGEPTSTRMANKGARGRLTEGRAALSTEGPRRHQKCLPSWGTASLLRAGGSVALGLGPRLPTPEEARVSGFTPPGDFGPWCLLWGEMQKKILICVHTVHLLASRGRQSERRGWQVASLLELSPGGRGRWGAGAGCRPHRGAHGERVTAWALPPRVGASWSSCLGRSP